MRSEFPDNTETIADRLYDTMAQDILPTDADVRAHFGFIRCESLEEEGKLLSLYKGLLYADILPAQLHQWSLRKTVLENVKQTYREHISPRFYWCVGFSSTNTSVRESEIVDD